MKNFSSLIFFGFFIVVGFSQPPCLPDSTGVAAGDEPPGCIMCGPIYQGSMDGYTPESPAINFLCGTIENSQWISLYPDHFGEISFTILPSNCMNGQGIQTMIFDSNLVPASNCFSSAGNILPINVAVSGLEPLDLYHIIIDGFSGDECDILFFNSSPRDFLIIDTVICPGSCMVFEDSCYYEAITLSPFFPCDFGLRLNISEADTGHFEINPFIDTFTNFIAYDWSDLGADSFDIYIDDVFEITQSFSSFFIPITPDLKDSFNLRVEPRSILGCSFKTADIDFPFEEDSSGFDEKKALDASVTISPNPSTSIFNLSSKSKILETTVFDLNGKEIMSSKVENLDLSSFENGVYLLKIQTDSGMVLKRVLKIEK